MREPVPSKAPPPLGPDRGMPSVHASKTERNGIIFTEFNGKACKAAALCYLTLSFNQSNSFPYGYAIAPRSPCERGA